MGTNPKDVRALVRALCGPEEIEETPEQAAERIVKAAFAKLPKDAFKLPAAIRRRAKP